MPSRAIISRQIRETTSCLVWLILSFMTLIMISLDTDDEAASSWESDVDIVEARMPESTIPAIMAAGMP